jgi:hypothetical protein
VTYAALDSLDRERKFTVVIDGMAKGADDLAFRWAIDRGVTTERYPAKWDDIHAADAVVRENVRGRLYNAAAGPQRNQRMLNSGIDLVVAFPGGTGTDDMIRRAEAAGIEVKRVSIVKKSS